LPLKACACSAGALRHLSHVHDEVVGLPRIVAGIAGDRDGRARPRELVEQRIAQRVVGSPRHAVGRRRGLVDVPNAQPDAPLPETGEAAMRVSDALDGVARNGQFDARSPSGPQRVGGDRLR
jgi:hypothetical protein